MTYGAKLRGRSSSWTTWCGAIAITTAALGVAPAGAATDTAVPGAPTVTSVKALVQGAAITFRPPANDGGERVLDYRVRCTSSNGGIATLRSAPDSPVEVHGMSVGKQYTCTVAARNINGLGKTSKPSGAVLPLPQPNRGLPGAPTNVHVKPGVASIFVTYTPPETSVGDLPINQYRARCRSTNGGVTKREKRRWMAPGIDVRHLTPGKTYQCDVAARNMLGYGPFSALSEDVVTIVSLPRPSAPAVTSATAITQGVEIAFRKPQSDGGARVVDYRVTCTSTEGGITRTQGGARSPIRVHGMSVGKSYTCVVAARNASGFGKASDPSDPVVPLAH